MEKIKIEEVYYDVLNINQKNNLLKIEFNEIVDLCNKNLTIIELYTSGGLKCATFESYTTIYKIYNKTIVLSNDGSVEPEVKHYTPTPISSETLLQECKKSKIKQSIIELERYIETHPLKYIDGLYYTVTKEKQNLLANRLLSYQLELMAGVEEPELTWNSKGEICVKWGYQDLVKLAIAIKNYVEPLVAKQQVYEKQIMACNTIEELNNVVINYETDI